MHGTGREPYTVADNASISPTEIIPRRRLDRSSPRVGLRRGLQSTIIVGRDDFVCLKIIPRDEKDGPRRRGATAPFLGWLE